MIFFPAYLLLVSASLFTGYSLPRRITICNIIGVFTVRNQFQVVGERTP